MLIIGMYLTFIIMHIILLLIKLRLILKKIINYGQNKVKN